MEFPLPHEPAHVAAFTNGTTIEDIVSSISANAGRTSRSSFAQELCLIMEGAYVTRHVTGNKSTVDIARRVARLVIASRCSALLITDEHREAGHLVSADLHFDCDRIWPAIENLIQLL